MKVILNPFTGQLQFVSTSSGGGGGTVDFNQAHTPYLILSNEIYTIPVRKQDVAMELIEVEGILAVDGKLYLEP